MQLLRLDLQLRECSQRKLPTVGDSPTEAATVSSGTVFARVRRAGQPEFVACTVKCVEGKGQPKGLMEVDCSRSSRKRLDALQELDRALARVRVTSPMFWLHC